MSPCTVYYRRRREKLEAQFGGRCEECGITYDLEFAHLKETALTGMGRGSYARLKDVEQHLSAYRLLCQPCHKAFDGPFYRNRYAK